MCQYVREGVLEEDSVSQTMKISSGLKSLTNSAVQRNLLLANFPKVQKH